MVLSSRGVALVALLALAFLQGNKVQAQVEPNPQVLSPWPTTTRVPGPGLVRTAGRHFIDPQGRVLILRGVNLAGDSKVPPFLPKFDAIDADRIAAIGANVVRLLFTWEAYEPEPGRYDEAYLAGLRRIVGLLWSRGIYTVIDFHQDGYSRFASRGAGDGFPAWAISPRGKLYKPDNSARSKNWPVLMFTDPATYLSFTDFFKDAQGVRTRYLAVFARIAQEFAATPGVIGYDPMNEPWGDEQDDLPPLYDEVASLVLKAHPTALLFLEGHVSTNSGIPSRLPRPKQDGAVYAPHYYQPSAVLLDRWIGGGLAIGLAFKVMRAKAADWGAPLFIGEYGLGAEAARAGAYVSAIQDRLDAHLASGTQWNVTPGWTPELKDGWNGEDFNMIDPATGNLRPNARPRPYPKATAGLPVKFVYEEAGGARKGPNVVYGWIHEPAKGETEVFLPTTLFPVGQTAFSFTPPIDVAWDQARQTLRLRSVTPGRFLLRVEGPPRL